MKVLVTGGTGFVGRPLVLRLLGEGHAVVALVRDAEKARSQIGGDVELLRADASPAELSAAMEDVDGVVNLAGEPIFVGRWSEARKAALVSSRTELTRRLVAAMAAAKNPPKVLVSASAVGVYGDRGDEEMTETSAPGSDFLADLCVAWEAEAMVAEAHGVRVVIPRLGIVLGREGGALTKMVPPIKAGVGGKLGSGRQQTPWIHLADLVEILTRALGDERYRGVYNATAPNPVTNAELTKALGRVLKRPTLFSVPGPVLKLMLGEAAGALLGGQRAVPKRLLELGHTFRFNEVEDALRDVLASDRGVRIEPARDAPEHPYLKRRGADFVLRQTTEIDAPLSEVFELYSKAENLGVMTPSTMGFEIKTPLPIEMKAGARIDYTIRIGPVPLSWTTIIERFEPGDRFVDTQAKGPYRSWFHTHRFEARGARTVMLDEVWFSVPVPFFGRIAANWFVFPQLRSVFAYRADATRFRYPGRDFLRNWGEPDEPVAVAERRAA